MLKGKNVLITGAARGIGKEIAIALAKEGANIIINDIEAMKEEAEKTADEIKSLGVDAEFFAGDVSNFDSMKGMVAKIQKKYEKIDILINNAGITKDRTLKKMVPEEWNLVVNINLTGMYNVTHNILPLIPEGGRIINISSIVGIGGNFGQCNYAASKSGIIGFTKSLAKELGKRKITVNAVAPGFIETDMTKKIPFLRKKMMLAFIPLKEAGKPEDVANAIVFLASDKARYITGEVLNVGGGFNF